jgi:hypothetical protein
LSLVPIFPLSIVEQALLLGAGLLLILKD